MIRAVILFIFLFNSFCVYPQNNRFELLCNSWKQIGYKSHNDSIMKPVYEDCSRKICQFGKDGSYEEEMYSLKGIGYWEFNKDSTKFDFQFSEFMGRKIGEKKPIEYFNKLILKLTIDTLIYGSEAYYGEERVYGHDDWYFIRQE